MKDFAVRRSSRARSQRGQAALLMTMSLPVMFGLLALVVDFGWAYWRREACRTAAAAAAQAVVASAGNSTPTSQSATSCPSSLDATKPWNVGCDFAVHNGFTNGVNNRTVTVAIGTGSTGIPISGVSPNGYWVSATVGERLPNLFSYVLNHANTSVSARATVATFPAPASATGCIYALETSGAGFYISNGNLATACGIYVNADIHGSNGAVTTTGGSKTYYHGTDSSSNVFSPATVYMSSTVSDLYASLSPPSCGAVQDASGPVSLSGTSTFVTLNPGTYNNQISISSGILQFNSGTYCLKQGVNFNGGTVQENTAGGELFYVQGGAVRFANGTITLNAPTSGTYQGILFYQPTDTSTNEH